MIHNIRYGFATNSSSTHSFVFVPGGLEVDDSGGEFGWQYFTTGTSKGKQAWLAHVVRANLLCLGVSDTREEITTIVKTLSEDAGRGSYVDHQSIPILPRAFGTAQWLDLQFLQDYQKFLLDPELVICGGNDNDDTIHPEHRRPHNRIVGVPLPKDARDEHWVARQDGLFWVVFDQNRGTKIRFQFPQKVPTDLPPYEKAFAPELVDIKITDFCGYGCKFCYQDSTPEGQHASTAYLYRVARDLRALRVFEVALGGGEPTVHPEFIEILEYFRNCGIVPNFTTRNFTGSWTRGRNLQRVFEAVGGIAFSVDDAVGVERIAAWCEDMGLSQHPRSYWYPTSGTPRPPQINVQIVLGAMRATELRAMLAVAHKYRLNVVLLGWKTTGRGSAVEPYPHAEWATLVQESGLTRIGVDTAVIQQFPTEARTFDPRGRYSTTQEGKFSMYIDAVSQRIGASSYVNPLAMRSLPIESVTTDNIQRAFARW